MPAGSRPIRRPSGRTLAVALAVVCALVAVVLVASPAGEAAKRLVLPKASVGEAQLRAGAVTRSRLAANAVDGTKVADGSLGRADLGAGSVDGTWIADGSLGAAELAPDSVDGSKIVDGSLGGADLGSVPGSKVDVASLARVPAAVRADALGTTVIVPVRNVQAGAGGTPVVAADAAGMRLELTCTISSVKVGLTAKTGSPFSGVVTIGSTPFAAEGPASGGDLAMEPITAASSSPTSIDVRAAGPSLLVLGTLVLDHDGVDGCSLAGALWVTPLP